MLYGSDWSKWQTKDSITRNLPGDHKDFVIIKATEGKTGKDPSTYENLKFASELGIWGIGFYHYARPENGNTPIEEAENFLDKVTETLKKWGENYPINIFYPILALDVEGDALKQANIDSWCNSWCQYVEECTYTKPLLYASKSTLSKFKSVAADNYGLWCASWGNDKAPSPISPWALCAFKQYRGNPLDLDVFYGDKDAYIRYAAVFNAHYGVWIKKIPETSEPEDTNIETPCKLGHDLWDWLIARGWTPNSQ